MPDDAERRAAAVYLAAMARELRQIAARHELASLAYIFAMAEVEAAETVQRGSADRK